MTICIRDGVDIENLKVSFVRRPSRKPSAFNKGNETETKSSENSSKSRNGEKQNGKSGSDGNKSSSVAKLASVESKVPPPAMSPSRPQQTFYFGQQQETVTDEKTERKQSAVDKVCIQIAKPSFFTVPYIYSCTTGYRLNIPF